MFFLYHLCLTIIRIKLCLFKISFKALSCLWGFKKCYRIDHIHTCMWHENGCDWSTYQVIPGHHTWTVKLAKTLNSASLRLLNESLIIKVEN